MNPHSLHVLEFDKIIRMVTAGCITEWLPVEIESSYVERFLESAEDAERVFSVLAVLKRLAEHPDFPTCAPIEDFRPLLEEVRVEGATAELELFAPLMRALREARAFSRLADRSVLADEFSIDPESCSTVGALFDGFNGFDDLYSILHRYLDDTGSLKEDRIPELVRIQKMIQTINQELIDTARSWMSGPQRTTFTSDVPVFREGRVLLPVKTDYKGRVEGIYHGSSDSGATVYIEPGPLLVQNNSLTEAKSAYQREIHRILVLLSRDVRNSIENLRDLFASWERFDDYLMRVRWMISLNATIPRFDSGDFNLPRARHPLLGKKAVPINLRFPEGCRAVVITGPNTGGKTVALKTLGLLTLLAQWGLPIPAGEGSAVPWCDGVFADIGDEQSIEENLSTFSAHLKNIAEIIVNSREGSLVLLDELGTGTDPHEGGCLALAVLEELGDKRCYSMITTHHAALKAFAYSRPDIENAAMEFDSRTNSPTYSLVYGLPGSSRALQTARRVGFPAHVLDRATALASDGSNSLEAVLESLNTKERELSDALEALEREEKRMEQERLELSEQREKLERRRADFEESLCSETNNYLAETRSRIERLIEEFRSGATKETSSAERELRNEVLRESAAAAERLEKAHETRKNLAGTRRHELRPGREVVVKGSSRRGTLIKETKKGKWLIAAGSVKLTLEADLLEPIGESSEKRTYYQPDELHPIRLPTGDDFEVSRDAEQTVRSPQFTLDVRGWRLEETITGLRDQIDHALVHGLHFFSIIHGKGTGALQAGIHDFLKTCSDVEEYHFARPEDGGTGKTLIYLRT